MAKSAGSKAAKIGNARAATDLNLENMAMQFIGLLPVEIGINAQLARRVRHLHAVDVVMRTCEKILTLDGSQI
jgi:hypothetical protein